MSKRLLTLAATAAWLLLCLSVAEAQSPGDWVLARYRGGGYWFPGVIQSTGGDRITVAYDDGDRETLSLSNVRPYDGQSVGGLSVTSGALAAGIQV